MVDVSLTFAAHASAKLSSRFKDQVCIAERGGKKANVKGRAKTASVKAGEKRENMRPD
jgi:hypothetical protein